MADSNFCQGSDFFKIGNKKKSHEAKSGEYGGWCNSSYPNSTNLIISSATDSMAVPHDTVREWRLHRLLFFSVVTVQFASVQSVGNIIFFGSNI